MLSKQKSTKQIQLKQNKTNLIVTTKFIIKRKLLIEINFHGGSHYRDGYYQYSCGEKRLKYWRSLQPLFRRYWEKKRQRRGPVPNPAKHSCTPSYKENLCKGRNAKRVLLPLTPDQHGKRSPPTTSFGHAKVRCPYKARSHDCLSCQ